MAKTDDGNNVDEATGEVTESRAVSMISQAFGGAGIQAAAADDPQAVQLAIVHRMLQADSLDELFGQWEAKTIDKFEGEVVTIQSVEWGTFNSDEGVIPLGRFTLTAKGGTESQVVIATSPNLTAFVARAEQLGSLPFTAKIVGAKTARGFTALHFERA